MVLINRRRTLASFSCVFCVRLFNCCLFHRWRIAHQAGRGRTPAVCPEIQPHPMSRPCLVVASVVLAVISSKTDTREKRQVHLLQLNDLTPASTWKINHPTKSRHSAESTDGAPVALRSDPVAVWCVFCSTASTLEAIPMTQTVSFRFFLFLSDLFISVLIEESKHCRVLPKKKKAKHLVRKNLFQIATIQLNSVAFFSSFLGLP